MKFGELIPIEVRSSIDLAFDKKLEEFAQLSHYITYLINEDFAQLIQILYRLDINEENLRHALRENPDYNTGEMIAEMIIERQLKKLESKKTFRDDRDIPDDERWK